MTNRCSAGGLKARNLFPQFWRPEVHDQLHPPETEVLAGCPPAEGPGDSASAALPAAGGRQHPRGLCPRQPLASPFGAGHSVCRPLGTRKPDDGLASSSLGARVADGVSAGVTPALGGIQSRARRPAPSAPLTSLRTRCRRRSRTRPGKGACLRGAGSSLSRARGGRFSLDVHPSRRPFSLSERPV